MEKNTRGGADEMDGQVKDSKVHSWCGSCWYWHGECFPSCFSLFPIFLKIIDEITTYIIILFEKKNHNSDLMIPTLCKSRRSSFKLMVSTCLVNRSHDTVLDQLIIRWRRTRSRWCNVACPCDAPFDMWRLKWGATSENVSNH